MPIGEEDIMRIRDPLDRAPRSCRPDPWAPRGSFSASSSGSHAPAWEQILTLSLAAGAAKVMFLRWSV